MDETDTANDWAQATDNDIDGKKVMHPGWDLDRYFQGVSVTVLLEGAPVGGLTDQERWICQQIENAGGPVGSWSMTPMLPHPFMTAMPTSTPSSW